jgi:hypothetical protein
MVSSFVAVALAAAQAAAPQAAIQSAPAAPAVPAVTVPAQAVQAPPVSAAPATAPTRLILWRNIEDRMTVDELHALYPAGPNVVYKNDRTILADVPIIEGCQAKVNVMHPNGVVKEIVMRGEGSIAGRCSLKLITALSGKYGEPMDKDKVGGSLFGRQGKNYIWARDGVTLQFKGYTNGPLGGGGLFVASWELRYSTNGSNIDL